MGSMSTVDDVLKSIGATFNAPVSSGTNGVTKTASVKSEVDKTRGALALAVKEAESLLNSNKTQSVSQAAQSQPSNTKVAAALTKHASQLLVMEKEAQLKEAQLLGVAVCDGFMARMREYDQAGQELMKTASGDDHVALLARTNPELFNKIASVGYESALEELGVVKSAQEVNREVAELQKFASEQPLECMETVKAGYEETWQLLEKAAATTSNTAAHNVELQKLASENPLAFMEEVKQGYADTWQSLEKLAAQAAAPVNEAATLEKFAAENPSEFAKFAEAGYKDTIELLVNLQAAQTKEASGVSVHTQELEKAATAQYLKGKEGARKLVEAFVKQQ